MALTDDYEGGLRGQGPRRGSTSPDPRGPTVGSGSRFLDSRGLLGLPPRETGVGGSSLPPPWVQEPGPPAGPRDATQVVEGTTQMWVSEIKRVRFGERSGGSSPSRCRSPKGDHLEESPGRWSHRPPSRHGDRRGPTPQESRPRTVGHLALGPPTCLSPEGLRNRGSGPSPWDLHSTTTWTVSVKQTNRRLDTQFPLLSLERRSL